RSGRWSPRGQRRLRALVEGWPRTDRVILAEKLDELARLEGQLEVALKELVSAYHDSPEARRLDAILGIDVVSAVSIVARIGPVERFGNAEALIAFAGLAPGIQQADRARRDGRIGGGGTDRHVRHHLIEATVWARKLPRYQSTYERVKKRRGSKVGRLVVARGLVRSIYKILNDDVAFDPGSPPRATPAMAG